jgi:hypothetical protein
MPTHLHLIDPSISGEEGIALLAKVLAGFTRRFFPGQRVWFVSRKKEPIQDALHLKRQIRYVLLNPCRDGLVSDPLNWEWSTHRDVMGAAYPPWVNAERLEPYFRCTKTQFKATFHAYVSGDPSVAVRGTPSPTPRRFLIASLPQIRDAVLIATRESEVKQRKGKRNVRRLIVHLAFRRGHPSQRELADLLQVQIRAIRWMRENGLTKEEEATILAAELVLSDQRLLTGVGRIAGLRRIWADQAV